jgi:lipid-A-disaccharide synthase
MRIFISAGEPSGDLHGANLARSLQTLRPGVECVGLGGAKMAAAGCDLLYPLADDAIMGFVRVLGAVPRMVRLLNRTTDYLREHRPDAVVLIDYPGFHWHLARRAKGLGIPVVSFVPPQIWAWASHRVNKMRKYFDHVLCSLPFEEAWYRERGVAAEYVGHPFFDELPRQQLDAEFVAGQQARPGPVVALLPGSRRHEVRHNLETLVGTAREVHAARPDARFLFACFREEQRAEVLARMRSESLPAEAHVGRTPEIIHLARACVAVSGSVGLELLYRGTPSVVVYRTAAFYLFLCRFFKNSRYISLVNLLAGRELYPEFLISRDEAAGPAGHVLRWLNDPAADAALRSELAALRDKVAAPGACDRAARFILERVVGGSTLREVA